LRLHSLAAREHGSPESSRAAARRARAFSLRLRTPRAYSRARRARRSRP